jgi:hypothetical protein
MNKFIYDGIVTGENFCDRADEVSKLKSYIKDSTNVLLIAKRRMGKTSLVNEVFKNHLSDKEYLVIYVDIFDITDELDFAKELYRACAKSFKLDFKQALVVLKDLFQKTSFEMTLGEDGTPSVNPKLASKDFDELLSDMFSGLRSYLERHNMKAAFCIDEFQQIKVVNRPLDATIRKYIQKHNNISYIFSGSKRNTLLNLFQGQSSPLMGMVTPMELGSIKFETFYKYAFSRVDIPQEEFRIIYTHSEGETKLIQHIMRNYVLLSAEGEVTADMAIENVLNEVDSICKSIFENLSANSRKTIKMLSEDNNVDGILSKENLNKHNISKSSLSSSIDSLLKQEIIYKDAKKYSLNGGIGATFSLWCKKRLRR